MTFDPGFRVETERLVLRPMMMDDAPELAQMFADPIHMRWYPSTKTMDQTRDWVRWVRRTYRQLGFGPWAMDLKTTGEFIGQCGLSLQLVEGKPFFELGWHTRRDYWGRGLATEAAKANRDLAFGPLGLELIISLVRPENTQSCRVAEKIGMKIWTEDMHAGFRHYVYSVTDPNRS